MKATKYFAALALMMGLVACQPEMFNGNTEVPDAESVAVVFSVQFPEPIPVATKGTMGEGPLASEAFDIHLCVYGSGQGYVQNWITASHLSTSTTTDEKYITGGTFKTFLPVTDEKRTIHIIANPPEEVVPITTDYLDNVMEKMVTGKNATTGQYEASYWQEVILEHGIHANQDGDIDNQSQLPMGSADLLAAFGNIHLLRNFAKLIVEGPSNIGDDNEPIRVHQWTYINVPKKGYVAPYNADATERFPKGYLNAFMQTNPSASAWWNQLVGTDKYPGCMPNDPQIIDTSFPGEPGADGVAEGVYVGDGVAKYMYERPTPTTQMAQTAILVQVEFLPEHGLYQNHAGEGLSPEQLEAANTYWYKVEVIDDKGAYVPILRNFVYTMHIKGLAVTGEATAEAAFKGSYFGNISASLETASLSDLSNGKCAIHVDQLDFIYTSVEKVGDEIQPKQLMNKNGRAFQYYFIPDLEDGTAYVESNEHCTIEFEVVNVAGFESYPAVVDGSVTHGEHGELFFTPYDIDPNHMKKSIIRIKGTNVSTRNELYREILITLMTTPNFVHVSPIGGMMTTTAITSTCDSTTIHGLNKAVDLRICLPEGLGSSMFPIQIRIEAENNTLSATSPKLPVVTGKSAFASKEGKNTFFYVYTINYSDYCYLDTRTRKYVYKYIFGDSADDKITFYTTTRGDNSSWIHICDMESQFNPVDLKIGKVEGDAPSIIPGFDPKQ